MKYLSILIVTLFVCQAYAQDEQRAAMKKLSFMVGNWEGSGWIVKGDGSRSIFNQVEDIKYDLDSTVLKLRGIGKNRDGIVIHDALGIVSYNGENGQYEMNAYLSDGRHTLAFMTLVDTHSVKWWFDPGNGSTIKYTLAIEDGVWTEKGSYTSDLKNWYPFLEFKLTKK